MDFSCFCQPLYKDIWLSIFSFLDIETIIWVIPLVCKNWKSFLDDASDSVFWKRIALSLKVSTRKTATSREFFLNWWRLTDDFPCSRESTRWKDQIFEALRERKFINGNNSELPIQLQKKRKRDRQGIRICIKKNQLVEDKEAREKVFFYYKEELLQQVRPPFLLIKIRFINCRLLQELRHSSLSWEKMEMFIHLPLRNFKLCQTACSHSSNKSLNPKNNNRRWTHTPKVSLFWYPLEMKLSTVRCYVKELYYWHKLQFSLNFLFKSDRRDTPKNQYLRFHYFNNHAVPRKA